MINNNNDIQDKNKINMINNNNDIYDIKINKYD